MLFKICQQPFFKLLIPLLLGISTYFINNGDQGVYNEILEVHVTHLLSVVLIISLLVSSKPLKAFIIVFSIGFSLVSIKHDLNNKNHFSKYEGKQIFKGLVVGPIKHSNDHSRFNIKVNAVLLDGRQIRASGNLLCIFESTNNIDLIPGDTLLFKSKVTKIKRYSTSSGFNPVKYYQSKNTFYQSYCDNNSWKVLGKASNLNILSIGYKTKLKILTQLREIHGDGSTFQIVAAILTGYTTSLDKDIRGSFAHSGVMHVLCVSGLHTGLVYSLVSFLIRVLFRFKYVPKKYWLLALVPIWFYALTTGFSPSVCRAALMISLYTIGKAFSQSVSPINILCATCFILLLINPFFLLNIGFQLSFLAVGGILIIYPILNKAIVLDNRLLKYLWSLICLSISAQIITTPICILYFGYTPVNFIAGNIIALPLTTVILYLSVILLPFTTISIVSEAYEKLSHFLCNLLIEGLNHLANIPFSTISIESISIWSIIGFYLFLIWIMIPLRNRIISTLQLTVIGTACYIVFKFWM